MKDFTVKEIQAMDPATLVETIAQMLYDRAEMASDAEDEAVTQPIKQRYREKYLTYCGAAEQVRNLLRD